MEKTYIIGRGVWSREGDCYALDPYACKLLDRKPCDEDALAIATLAVKQNRNLSEKDFKVSIKLTDHWIRGGYYRYYVDVDLLENDDKTDEIDEVVVIGFQLTR